MSSPKGKPKITIIPADDELTPACKNCKWGDRINGTPWVHCGVDLPPFVKQSDNPAAYKAHQDYVCVFHKVK